MLTRGIGGHKSNRDSKSQQHNLNLNLIKFKQNISIIVHLYYMC